MNRVRLDPLLLGAVLALTALGLVMVYSSSAVAAQEKLGDPFFFLKRQLIAAGVAFVALAITLKLGYRRLARFAYPLMIVTLLLLVLVLIPGVGTLVGGARRWIRAPGVSIQPAEVAKFAWVVFLAYSLAKKRDKVTTFSVGFLPHMLGCGLLIALCMLQPDFGSSVSLLFVMFVLLFAAGTKLSYLFGSMLVAIPFAYHAVASSKYRSDRIMAFLEPWEHRHGVGYQLTESLMSIGSGGLWGLGLGEGRQKLFFLPEAHTDFIFAIIGEELGLIGVAFVIGLYAIIIWRGIRAAINATETFGTYLALGVTTVIGFQATVNMGVAMGLLPTKGLTLPFISYGGSSLIMMMVGAGVLLSVAATGREAAPSRSFARPSTLDPRHPREAAA